MQAQVQDSIQIQQQPPQVFPNLTQPPQNNNFQQGSDNEQVLKDMKRGAQQIARQLKQFEILVARFEKKGVVISSDIKTKIEELKQLPRNFYPPQQTMLKIWI